MLATFSFKKMNARWILLLYILKIHLKTITPQHHHHHHHYYDDPLQQYNDEDDTEDSEGSSFEYISRRINKHRSKFTDSEECFCTCNACFSYEGPKPCCTEFCKYCNTDTGFLKQQQYVNHEQKVVFVPFPYPLIVPNQPSNDDTAETTITTTTVTTANPVLGTPPQTEKPVPQTPQTEKPIPWTPETEKPVVLVKPNKSKLKSKSIEVGMLSRHRHMKQINPDVKRTRPAWVPKYGIVPIPDHLAAKLMTQLTEVRALKAKRL